jgi:hypothetical protein
LEVYTVGNRSRRGRVALVVAMVPVGVLLAALFAAGSGPGIATAKQLFPGASGASADTTTTTTSTQSLTPTSTSTTSSTTTTSSGTTTSKSTSTSTTTTNSSTSTGVPVLGCVGDLSPATPTDTDPNLTNYSFHCNGQVTAYSIVVNRPAQAYNELDDFSVTANVIDPTTEQPSTTESFNCQGGIPGSGISCLIASPATSADTWSLIQGQFDTTTPFCPTLPAHAKPGTKPSAGAVAYLVVSDPTGEEVGPWIFQYSPRCPAVKPVPKAKVKKTTRKRTTKKHAAKKQTTTKRTLKHNAR